MQLTNRAVDTFKPKDKPYEVYDDTIKGFLLRVQPSGTMVYYLAYRNSEGKKHRYRIGTHGTITAVQARNVAEKKSGAVALSVDVHEVRKEERIQAEIDKSKTLKAFIEERYKPWVVAHRKSGERTIQMLKKHFNDMMETPLDEITLWNAQKWCSERLKEKRKPATVNRNIAALKALLTKAVEWDIIETSPLGSGLIKY